MYFQKQLLVPKRRDTPMKSPSDENRFSSSLFFPKGRGRRYVVVIFRFVRHNQIRGRGGSVEGELLGWVEVRKRPLFLVCVRSTTIMNQR